MKKIIFAFCFLFMTVQSMAFADEVVDANGNITPCKIETVQADFVQYSKDGNRYTFTRENDSLIFNDYVDVQTDIYNKNSIKRIFGKITVKDSWSVVIQNEEGKIDIPFYKVKFIGIYKP